MTNDILNMLRLGSLFGPTTPNQGVVNQDSMTPQFMQNFNPSYAAQDALQQHVNSMPNIGNYNPSGFRQVLGVIAGLGAGGPAAYSNGAALGYKSDIPGGRAIQEATQYAPYYRDLGQWEGKLKPLGDVAELENRRNINERQIHSSELSNKLGQDKLVSLEKDRDTKNDIAQQKAETARMRAEAYVNALKFKQDHPEMDSQETADGRIVYVDPTNPARQVDTGLKSADMSELEKYNLLHKNRLSEIGAQGEQSRKTVGARHDASMEEIDERAIQDVNKPPNITTTETSVTDAEGKPVGTRKTQTVRGYTGKTVKMRAPNGQTKQVNESEVEHYKKLGAVVVK